MRTYIETATRTVVVTVLALSAFAKPVHGCSMSFPRYVVAQPIRIHVDYRGTSVPGIHIELSNSDDSYKTVAKFVTDTDGVVQFDGFPAGNYFVGISQEGGLSGGAAEITLVPSGDSRLLDDQPIELGWPTSPIVEARRAAGTLEGLPSTKLVFREILSRNVAGTTTTDKAGKFDLGSLPPGLYEVETSFGKKSPDGGSIAFEVADAATAETVDLKVEPHTSCGLMYSAVDPKTYAKPTKEPEARSKCGLVIHDPQTFSFERLDGKGEWVAEGSVSRDKEAASFRERALLILGREGMYSVVSRQQEPTFDTWADINSYCVDKDGSLSVYSELSTIVHGGIPNKLIVRRWRFSQADELLTSSVHAYSEKDRLEVTLDEKDNGILATVPAVIGSNMFPSPKLIVAPEHVKPEHAQTH
jgi:hypothetical protein